MVMAQINAKYLLKELGKIMGGNEPKSEYLAYLKNIQTLVELKCKGDKVETFLTTA